MLSFRLAQILILCFLSFLLGFWTSFIFTNVRIHFAPNGDGGVGELYQQPSYSESETRSGIDSIRGEVGSIESINDVVDETVRSIREGNYSEAESIYRISEILERVRNRKSEAKEE